MSVHRFISYRHGAGSMECKSADGVHTVVVTFYGHPPRLAGMRFVEIEYFPRVNARVLAADNPDQWRPMTDQECEIADEALYRMRDNALQPTL
jgi:hypothetical protein